MLKTLFASTAIATTLGFAAVAQQAADPSVNPGSGMQGPADAAPPVPATEAQPIAPSTPTGSESAQEPSPMAPATETAEEPAAPGTMATPPVAATEQVLTPVPSADISVDKLKGADIQTRDGQTVASIDDLLMSSDGQVESYVAQFGGFLGFGSNKVLLTPDEVEVLQDQLGTFVVQTDLTPELLEGRPEYQAN